MIKEFSEIKICDPVAVKNMIVIHYGSKEYKPELVKKIKNYRSVKPIGGLWTSPINSNWSWKDWCKAENYGNCRKQNMFKLKFNIGARIAIVDSYRDLMFLPLEISDVSHLITCINFELLATQYDAIWLTEKGQRETHLSNPLNLYGWDCETVFIMNSATVYQTK